MGHATTDRDRVVGDGAAAWIARTGHPKVVIVNHDPVSGDEMEPEEQRGIEAFRRHAESILEGFPDLSFDVQDTIAEGNKVMVRLVLTGTHDGRAMGFEPTGKEVEFSSIIVYRFNDGKIVERWGESNSLGVLRRIGALSSRAGA